MDIIVREAKPRDNEAVRNIHLDAFPESENQQVAHLAINLLADNSIGHCLSLVAENGGQSVGHIAFSPLRVHGIEDWRGYILAPLGVKSESQGMGIGTKLIRHGLAILEAQKARRVFVYGDPMYYEKFGFTSDLAKRFLPPHKLEYPFGWQALIINVDIFDQREVQLTCVDALDDPELW